MAQTVVRNLGKAAIELPAPYLTLVVGGAQVVVSAPLPTVAATLARALPYGQFRQLQLSVPEAVSVAPQPAPATPAPTVVEAPTSQTVTATQYQTRITNLTTTAQVLPDPYNSTVLGGGSVVVGDPVSVVTANLAKLPTWQQAFWQVSVVAPTPTPTPTPASGPFDLEGQRAINAANPIDPQDLTTKSYVDALIGQGGGTNTKVVATPQPVSVGDCVKITATGAVKVNPLDAATMPSLGVIVAVASEASATVQFAGETAAVLSGLVAGTRYFIGNDGRLSPAIPSGAALVQVIGLATSSSQLLVMPSLSPIQRSA